MSENKLKISILQIDLADGDLKENRRRVEDLLKKALNQRKKPDVLVLPELWNTGYDLKRIKALADKEGVPSIPWIQEMAKKGQVNIVAGSIADRRPSPNQDQDEQIYNSSYIINRDGEILARYDKVHLLRLRAEDKCFTPGSEAVTFELEGISCGVVIGHDLRFPEFVRKLALLGAKVLFIPAQWPKPRPMHWKLLNIVRAIENQFYVVAVNRVGQDKNLSFPGLSLVANPWGELLLEGDDQPGLLTTVIDIDVIDQVRRHMSVFEDRRPETYG